MNLHQQTVRFLVWALRVLRAFFAVRPWTTAGTIVAAALARVTRLLAFFLPLKVILLAGSDGVPRYFPFIAADDKMLWIGGLALGAFVAYGLTLALEWAVGRWSEGAAGEILAGANEMTLLSDQRERVQTVYTRLCTVAADGTFVILGGCMLLVLDPALAATLAVVIAGQYAFSSWALAAAGRMPATSGPLALWIGQRLRTYLGILNSTAFLLGFVVILAPFLTGAGGNILLALLALIVLRQWLNALGSGVQEATRLEAQQADIDALVFRDAPRRAVERHGERSLRELFAKGARQERSRAELAPVLGPEWCAEVAWADAPFAYLHTLAIVARGADATGGDSERRFQQQVFPLRSRVHLDNETFLFRHVERARLHAPARRARFDVGPFASQIVDAGQGRPLTAPEWKVWREHLAISLLACHPPPALVAGYTASYRLLPQRLQDPQRLERLWLAVDGDAEARWLDAFAARLGAIAERLHRLPLCIDNVDFDRSATDRDGAGQPLLMYWGRWSLEPLGACRFTLRQEVDVGARLAELATLRPGLAPLPDGGDIELAGLCRRLDLSHDKGHWKAAVAIVGEIVDHWARIAPAGDTPGAFAGVRPAAAAGVSTGGNGA